MVIDLILIRIFKQGDTPYEPSISRSRTRCNTPGDVDVEFRRISGANRTERLGIPHEVKFQRLTASCRSHSKANTQLTMRPFAVATTSSSSSVGFLSSDQTIEYCA